MHAWLQRVQHACAHRDGTTRFDWHKHAAKDTSPDKVKAGMATKGMKRTDIDDEHGMQDAVMDYIRTCGYPQSAASVMAHLKQHGIIPRTMRKAPVNAMLYALVSAGVLTRHDVQPPTFGPL